MVVTALSVWRVIYWQILRFSAIWVNFHHLKWLQPHQYYSSLSKSQKISICTFVPDNYLLYYYIFFTAEHRCYKMVCGPSMLCLSHVTVWSKLWQTGIKKQLWCLQQTDLFIKLNNKLTRSKKKLEINYKTSSNAAVQTISVWPLTFSPKHLTCAVPLCECGFSLLQK